MIVIKNKRCKRENILKEYPDAVIFDVTSKGAMKHMSPFYPHGHIPVPGMEGVYSASVEGIWQGLKVFEGEGIDRRRFANKTMLNLKRTCRTHGRCLGHMYNGEPIGYIEARKKIYIPSYYYMLEHYCAKSIETIKKLSAERTVVLLDYDTNENIDDWKKPLSHAGLIKRYVMDEDAYHMTKLLDTKVTDLFSRADTLEILKNAGVITLRDLVNVNHSKVQWGKASFSEVCELMDSVNLSFANSPLENKFFSQVAEFSESCAEALNRLDELDI